MNIMMLQINNTDTMCHACPACFHPMAIDDPRQIENKPIPIFYSEREVRKAGWVATKSIYYCPPERDYVWVCPDCWKEKYKK